jgi:hypothetical protein
VFVAHHDEAGLAMTRDDHRRFRRSVGHIAHLLVQIMSRERAHGVSNIHAFHITRHIQCCKARHERLVRLPFPVANAQRLNHERLRARYFFSLPAAMLMALSWKYTRPTITSPSAAPI